MPLKGFICPISRQKVGFDHFDTCTDGRNKRAAFPPWQARYIALGAIEDVRHSTFDLTATRCLSCPRKDLIAVTQDYYIDPNKRGAMVRGTALHEVAARNLDPAVWYNEETGPFGLACPGYLFPQLVAELGTDELGIVTAAGVRLSAKLDAVRKDWTEIVNWKFPKDWSVQFRPKTGIAKDDAVAQVNIERLLLAQQQWAIDGGYSMSTVNMTIWDHALGRDEGPTALMVPHATEEEILAHKPGGGEWTVADIVSTRVKLQREYEKVKGDPLAVERLCADAPCCGKGKMFGGKAHSDYCDVNTISDTLERKYGAPK